MSTPHPPHAHEESDIHVRNVLWTAAVLVAAVLFVHLVVYGAILLFHGGVKGSPWRHNTVTDLPPTFRTYPSGEALRREQEAKLNSYGWVDRNNGVAHIPIERAIDLYVERHRGERVGVGPKDCTLPSRTAGSKECDPISPAKPRKHRP